VQDYFFPPNKSPSEIFGRNVLLSLRQATFDAFWEKLELARAAREPQVVLGKSVNQSGVTVEVEGILAFIPGSQLGKEAAANPQALIGKYFKAIPLEIDKSANRVVLSEKAVSDAEDLESIKNILKNVKKDHIYDGIVTTITSFGCFVKLELEGKNKKSISLEGLVHISELSWSKVANVFAVVKVGDKVKVKVLDVQDGRLALSIKQVAPNPWDKAATEYKIESKYKGKVVKISDFGVFVELEPGIEGLIHITKIPPASKLAVGQEISVIVEEIDTKAKKMSLGLVLSSKPIGYK